MANFNLVVNSQFDPFSYQELLAPVLMATQAHQALEETYSNLDTQANTVGSLTNEINDPVAYRRYKAYDDALKQGANDLAMKGLTPVSRQSLMRLRSQYAKDIIPIQNATTRRRELADEQRKALLQNPTMLFQRDLNTLSQESSLDRFLENPNYDYGNSYSGALLAQQVSQAAANLAKELTYYGNGKRLDGFTKTFMQRHGYTREQVLEAINNPNDKKAQPVLNSIVDQVMESSGIAKWANKDILDRAYSYARSGLWSAVGQTQVSPYEDKAAVFEAQEAMQIRKERRAAARAAQQQQQINKVAINPLNIYSTRELEQQEKAYQNNERDFKKYFYTKNGKGQLTHAGWVEYNRKIWVPSTSWGKHTLIDSPFKVFMDSLGAKGFMTSRGFGNYQRDHAGALLANYFSESPLAKSAKYDASKITEYDYSIDPSDQKRIKNAVLTADNGAKFKGADYNSKLKTFEDTGERLTPEDLNSDEYEITAFRTSPYGTTMMVKDDKGVVKRYFAPKGMSTTNELNRDKSMNEATVYGNIVTTGKYPNPHKHGEYLQASPSEIKDAQLNYENALQNVYLFQSQIGLTNSTNKQNFNPYGY